MDGAGVGEARLGLDSCRFPRLATGVPAAWDGFGQCGVLAGGTFGDDRYRCARGVRCGSVNTTRCGAAQRPTREAPSGLGFPADLPGRQHDRNQQPLEQSCAGSALGTFCIDRPLEAQETERRVSDRSDGSFRIEAHDRRVLKFDESYHFAVKDHERLYLRMYIVGTCDGRYAGGFGRNARSTRQSIVVDGRIKEALRTLGCVSRLERGDIFELRWRSYRTLSENHGSESRCAERQTDAVRCCATHCLDACIPSYSITVRPGSDSAMAFCASVSLTLQDHATTVPFVVFDRV